VPAPEPGIREHPVPKPHLEGYFVVFGGWTQGISDAGGIPAGSRWLSAATPPVTGSRGIASRQGCQPRQDVDRTPLRFLDRGFLDAAGTLRGVGRSSGVGLRWCRCAQPPATRFDPSGIHPIVPVASIDLATHRKLRRTSLVMVRFMKGRDSLESGPSNSRVSTSTAT